LILDWARFLRHSDEAREQMHAVLELMRAAPVLGPTVLGAHRLLQQTPLLQISEESAMRTISAGRSFGKNSIS